MADLRPSHIPTRDTVKRAEQVVDAILAGRVFTDIVIPRTQVRGKMRIVSRAEASEATRAARAQLSAAGYAIDMQGAASLGTIEEWNSERALQFLAAAVRDPERPELPLASVDEWRQCDDDQIGAMWSRYQDFAAQYDPLASDELSEADMLAIAVAAKKKERLLLMAFGSSKLAAYVTTTVAPPAS